MGERILLDQQATGAAVAGPAPLNTTHPLPTFGWVTLGDARNDGGLNLRPQPSADAWFKTPQKIADRTKLLVDRQAGKDWAHVTLTDGRSGWVDSQFVDTRWPEPDAQLHRVVAGDSAFSLAHQYYEQDARLIRGIDKRFFVTVLAYVNPHLNIDDLRPSPAEYLWVPSARFAFSLAGILSHGTLTGGAWAELSGAWSGAWSATEGAAEAAWGYVEGNVAFDVGLLQGAWDAVWSTITGLAGLAKLPFDLVFGLVRDLITGTLVGKAGALWDTVTHLDLGKLLGTAGTAVGLALKDFAAKWNDPDVIKRWNFRGFVVGEALVQVLLTVFSGGAFAALKAVSRAGELADLIARVPAVERLVGAAGDLKGAGAEALRGALTGLKGAQEWAATVLKIPAEVLVDLSADAINRLRTLPDWMLQRLRDLDLPILRRILGCASPCKVDIQAIRRYLVEGLVADEQGAHEITSLEQLVTQLQSYGMKTDAFTDKLGDGEILSIIKQAHLTDKDFAGIRNFIPDGRKSVGKIEAYRLFTQYLDALIPAKFGPNLKPFVELTRPLNGPAGRSLKGYMFENFVKLYVPYFRDLETASRATVVQEGVSPVTCDLFEVGSGAMWDFKNQVRALEDATIRKYDGVVGKTTTTGHIVTSINFLFTDSTIADANYGSIISVNKDFRIWYLLERGGEIGLHRITQ